jgi:hypothetical protein
MTQRLSLTDYALRERLSYHQARTRLLRGELVGGKDEFGRFFVEVSLPEPSGQQQDPAS